MERERKRERGRVREEEREREIEREIKIVRDIERVRAKNCKDRKGKEKRWQYKETREKRRIKREG